MYSSYKKNGDWFEKAVIGVFVVLGLLLVFVFVSQCTGNRVEAEAMLIETAESMGYESPKAQCQSRDTDGNGKVSCTLAYGPADQPPFTERWECPSAFSLSDTCQKMW